jgi:hypothetical protein
MDSRYAARWKAGAVVLLAFLVMLSASTVAALKSQDSETEIRSGVESLESARFLSALTDLAVLDEPGALNIWRVALSNQRADLRAAAWQRYRSIQAELNRKTSVPQVARIIASQEEVLKSASKSGLDATVWVSSPDETIAAVPPYLVERLEHSGISCEVLYDTIAEWQAARATGDAMANAITPTYMTADGQAGTQIRIAVIDLSRRSQPESGFTDWLGDPEDILIRDGSRIAYMDTFQSDGSDESVAEHVERRFTRKGYSVLGYYTPEQFSTGVTRWFPGKRFNPGRPKSSDSMQGFLPFLAEGSFHSYDETRTEFRSLADSHPDLASFVQLGSSYEGREVFALKISRNVQGNDPTKPDVLITGCHHAREWISVEPPVYFANRLLNGYATDDSLRFLVDNLQIWIVPIVNPDGLTYSQGSPNDRMDLARTWRKNRRPISIGPCVTSVGVDLNRNYPFQWRLDQDSPCADYCTSTAGCLNDDIGASDDPRDEVYRGPTPESEPEIRAIKALIDDPSHRFRAQIDYHNYAQLIMYPWSFEAEESPDATVLADLADRMSNALRSVNNKLYRPEQAINLYPTTGSSADYAYGVNKVPAPFVIEMRPDCCNFNVPESDIDPIDRENWAGARPLLDWALGPPILQAVSAYSRSSDGTLNLVYAGHWVPSAGAEQAGRELVVDTRLDRVRAGPLLVQLQFSQPMDASAPPTVTLGRSGLRDEVAVVANGGPNEGWQKTVYPNDTWIGEGVIFQDFNETDSWGLAVLAQNSFGMKTDGRPGTIADYTAGLGHWTNLEDENGEGFNGGFDLSHSLAPTLRDDFPGIFIATPAGGERFAGADTIELAWTVAKGESFDPAQQTLFFSTDAGRSFATVASSIPGFTDKFAFSLPAVATTGARFRIQAIDRSTGNSVFGESRGDFTIGTNVGSGVDIAFVSSEKTDLSWSDMTQDGETIGGSSRLTINLSMHNRGTVPIINPFLVISQLNKGNILLSRDPSSRVATGARQTIDTGSDNILSPGGSAQVHLLIGLVANKKFKTTVEMYGVPSGGAIAPAGAVKVWKAKPGNR